MFRLSNFGRFAYTHTKYVFASYYMVIIITRGHCRGANTNTYLDFLTCRTIRIRTARPGRTMRYSVILQHRRVLRWVIVIPVGICTCVIRTSPVLMNRSCIHTSIVAVGRKTSTKEVRARFSVSRIRIKRLWKNTRNMFSLEFSRQNFYSNELHACIGWLMFLDFTSFNAISSFANWCKLHIKYLHKEVKKKKPIR